MKDESFVSKMSAEERKALIVARGEHSDHCHVLLGDVKIEQRGDTTVAVVGPAGATMKHILESAWVGEGREVWTGEHHDIKVDENREFKVVGQFEYHPYSKVIQRVQD